MEVVLEEPERMNLLGLFMKSALESRLEHVERARVRGDIALTGGSMSCTLSFSPDRVVVRKGVAGDPKAHLKGPLDSLVQIARGKAAGELISRRSRISGNPMAALPLARVFAKKGT